MVRFKSIMGGYMIASGVSVSAGAIILRYYGMVPIALTYITATAVCVLGITAYLVLGGSERAVNFGVILSILAIISSASSPAHLSAMKEIFHGGLTGLLDILEILGFYLFPAVYIISWLRQRNRVRSRNKKTS